MNKNNSESLERSHTQSEIKGQPKLWKTVYNLLRSREAEINDFLEPLLKKNELQIILSGAGSSAFVGEAAQGIIQKETGCTTSAIATTDIVTHPELFLQNNKPTLLVSFARSGNSPESVETVKLIDGFCQEAYHLIITCNREGKLAEYAQKNQENAFAVLLPEEANDKSLAMTGSFTSMLLSVLLIFQGEKLENLQKEIETIIDQANKILQEKAQFAELTKKDAERVVFLGSGPMLGIARECHLKLQELSDGAVICKHDSFLGFRHGPRAVINEKTLMVYLFSSNDHVYQYELDLVKSIAKDPREIACISVGRNPEEELHSILNIDLNFESAKDFQIVPATLVGQLLGLYKSIHLGLNPDNPSKSGSISRVVEGVIIYEYPKKVQV